MNALPASNQTFDMKIHWLLDSGASIHVTDDLSDFTNYHKQSETATTATGIKANMEGSGTVHLQIYHNGQPHKLILDNVHYIPKLSSKIISAGLL